MENLYSLIREHLSVESADKVLSTPINPDKVLKSSKSKLSRASVRYCRTVLSKYGQSPSEATLSEITGIKSYASVVSSTRTTNEVVLERTYSVSDTDRYKGMYGNVSRHQTKSNSTATPHLSTSSAIVPVNDNVGNKKSPDMVISDDSGREIFMNTTVMPTVESSSIVQSDLSQQLSSVLTRLEALERQPVPAPPTDVAPDLNTMIESAFETKFASVTSRI